MCTRRSWILSVEEGELSADVAKVLVEAYYQHVPSAEREERSLDALRGAVLSHAEQSLAEV